MDNLTCALSCPKNGVRISPAFLGREMVQLTCEKHLSVKCLFACEKPGMAEEKWRSRAVTGWTSGVTGWRG